MLEVPADGTSVFRKWNNTPFQLAYGGFLTQEIGINLVPVEGGEGGAEVRVLVVVQQTFKARFCVTDLCDECKTVEARSGLLQKQALYSSHCDHVTAARWPHCTSKQIDFNPTAPTTWCLERSTDVFFVLFHSAIIVSNHRPGLNYSTVLRK